MCVFFSGPFMTEPQSVSPQASFTPKHSVSFPVTVSEKIPVKTTEPVRELVFPSPWRRKQGRLHIFALWFPLVYRSVLEQTHDQTVTRVLSFRPETLSWKRGLSVKPELVRICKNMWAEFSTNADGENPDGSNYNVYVAQLSNCLKPRTRSGP